MITNPKIRIDYLKMSDDCQIITPTKSLNDLQKVLEENSPKKITTGQTVDLKTALNESENFMKSIFRLHQIYFASVRCANETMNALDTGTEVEFLEAFNKLGTKIDVYSLPVELVAEGYWYGVIGNLVLPLSKKELLEQEKIMYSHLGLSKKINRLTGRIISHEITHSQIDSNRGSTNYHHNYEVIPMFIELLHKSPDPDSDLFTSILVLIREKSIIDQLIYLKSCYYLGTEDRQKLIMSSTYLISNLKAFNLYEVYLNSSIKKQQAIINQIQKIFDGEMLVESLLESYDITMEKGIESAKRFAKEKKREFTS